MKTILSYYFWSAIVLFNGVSGMAFLLGGEYGSGIIGIILALALDWKLKNDGMKEKVIMITAIHRAGRLVDEKLDDYKTPEEIAQAFFEELEAILVARNIPHAKEKAIALAKDFEEGLK